MPACIGAKLACLDGPADAAEARPENLPAEPQSTQQRTPAVASSPVAYRPSMPHQRWPGTLTVMVSVAGHQARCINVFSRKSFSALKDRRRKPGCWGKDANRQTSGRRRQTMARPERCKGPCPRDHHRNQRSCKDTGSAGRQGERQRDRMAARAGGRAAQPRAGLSVPGQTKTADRQRMPCGIPVQPASTPRRPSP